MSTIINEDSQIFESPHNNIQKLCQTKETKAYEAVKNHDSNSKIKGTKENNDNNLDSILEITSGLRKLVIEEIPKTANEIIKKKENLDKNERDNEHISRPSTKKEKCNNDEEKIKREKENNLDKSKKKKNVDNKRNENKNGYGQDHSIKGLNMYPPKASRLFFHNFNLINENQFSSDNDYISKINKDKIPNVFYNHLMTKFVFNRNIKNYITINSQKKSSYVDISTTKRNKNKLLTLIYLTPLNVK